MPFSKMAPPRRDSSSIAQGRARRAPQSRRVAITPMFRSVPGRQIIAIQLGLVQVAAAICATEFRAIILEGLYSTVAISVRHCARRLSWADPASMHPAILAIPAIIAIESI